MARTGMFVAPATGNPPVGMAPTDGRLVLGGLFQVASQLVAGGGFTASSSAMTMTVNQAVWGLTDPTNTSAAFFSPTDSTLLTFSAAPATGGRIDLVVVKQNNVENGDADSRANVYIVPGTASGSPVAPAVPAGAAKYLAVLINAGVTNIAAATITNYMQTTFAEPRLQAPTLAALNTATGVLSQHATVTADPTAANNGDYLWTGSSWVGGLGTYTPTWTGGTTNPSIGNGTLTGRWFYINPKLISLRIDLTFGSSTTGGSGSYGFSLPAGMTSATGEQDITAKAYLAGGGTVYQGLGQIAGGGTVVNPLFPSSSSVSTITGARNADSGGGTGTGVPVAAGAYTYTSGSVIVIQGLVEIA